MTLHSDFLYGTAWKEEDTQRCVRDALAAGFRAIDTANQRKHYFEAAVGAALEAAFEAGPLTRDDLFLQTKFTFIHGQDERLPYNPHADVKTQVHQSFDSSLEHLQTDRVDSYILHGPSGRFGLSDADWDAWRAMEEIAESGRIGALGVSNMSLEQIQELYRGAKIKPSYVQNRCFAKTGWDQSVRKFCTEHGMTYQGFSLLTANAQVFRQPSFSEMAERLRATPAQLVFRFARQIGMWPLTGTTNPAHMREDLDFQGDELTQEDLKSMEHVLI